MNTLVLRCPECKEIVNCNVYVNPYDDDSEFELKVQCRECAWVGFQFVNVREMLTEQKAVAL